MKVMKRKVKTGSSLLYVVILTAMLITFGTAVFTLTVTDYKMRIREGNKIKNLYGAESGLEEAYGKLSNLLFTAVESGQKAIKESDDENTAKENFKVSYKDTVEKNIKATLESEYISQNGYSPHVTIITSEEKLKFKNDKMSMVIQSSFVDKSNLRKTVESTFNITVPEYEGVTSSVSATVPVKPAWSKAIVAKENLISNGMLNLEGGAYIEGHSPSQEKGVILLSEQSKVSVKNGDLITAEDILLNRADCSFSVDNSNVFTGSMIIGKEGSHSDITIGGKVYANNDLALNANRSKIRIYGGFYGINDKTEEGLFEEDSKRSSSIYVNNDDLGKDDGSYIDIGNEALLMGTAYIKTNPHYQTGESVAIKGNYVAYSEGLDNANELSEDNIVFANLDPMQLADSFKDGTKLSYKDKIKYIEEYMKSNPNDVRINYGAGIKLPGNTTNVGGIFTNGKFVASNYKVDDGDRVKNIKDEYERAVNSVNLNDDIRFGRLSHFAREENNEVLYLYNDEDKKPINIVGNNWNVEDIEGRIIEAKVPIKGVIITNVDVVIRGDVNFTGTIITSGNVIIDDSSNLNITYNGDYVQSVIGNNYELFKDILSNSPDSVVVNPKNNSSLINAVDTKKLISIKNWKLIK